jgi:hypothetical protein
MTKAVMHIDTAVLWRRNCKSAAFKYNTGFAAGH